MASAGNAQGSSSSLGTLRRDALGALTDEQLVERARGGGQASSQALDELYSRYYSKVSGWCLRICGRRLEAADLAQEVFLRVHTRLHTFRAESRFSTWLYTVTRSVSINRGRSAQYRQERELTNFEQPVEGLDPAPRADDSLAQREGARELQRAMQRILSRTELKVMYLHFVDGLTLAAITRLLELDNKSGAKAYVVSAKRKLKRSLGKRRGPAPIAR